LLGQSAPARNKTIPVKNRKSLPDFPRKILTNECGTFLVNSFEEGDMTQPFGGYKQSGNAKDKCFESLLSYMNTKAAWLRLNQAPVHGES
jgi:hypothetical protein